MKHVSSLLAFAMALVTLAVQAQQITLRKETVFVDGKPYCGFIKSGSAWARDYSFRNSKNEELVSARPVIHELGEGQDYVYYEITVKGFAAKAELEDHNNLDRLLATEIFRNQVIKGDQLDREGAGKLLAKFPPTISARLKEQEKNAQLAAESFTVKGPDPGSPAPDAVILVPSKKVDAKASASTVTSAEAVPANLINLNGNSIFKDNVKIGQFKVIDQEEDGKKERIYSVFNTKNKIAAVVSFATPDSPSCTLSTTSDSQSHVLDLKNDSRAMKAIAEWLVQHQYL